MIETPRSTSEVSILIPAFGGAHKLRACLASLARYAPSDCRIFVLDDGTPDRSIAECCEDQALQNLTYVRSDVNRGFVCTCNWGWKQVAPPYADILLLNSDTEVTEGFLEEMLRVLYLHERHGVVTPRSNNATIYSIPFAARDVSPEESYEIWQDIRSELPAYGIMPTAVGFCMLIKALVLERFGLFDEIYSPGYNEENDFVCRIDRYGFSAIVANHAFVFHYESSTFGSRRKALEREHREILLDRFPEYERKISDYVQFALDPVERFSILRRPHRPAILFDLFHLPARHSGTSEFGLNLLREVHTQLEDECDLFTGLSKEGRFFAGELDGYRLFEDRPGSEMLFDLVFKPSQIFTWAEFRRMHRLAPRLSFVLQDIIAVRCSYLTSEDRKTIFRQTLQLSDQVYTISEFSRSDVEAFFDFDIAAQVIHHGTNFGITADEVMPGEYVLLMGNNFAHKGVQEALEHLTDVGPVLVLGGEFPREELPAYVRWFTSGNLTRGHIRELMTRASVLVYPSHYEGYGLPIIDALALGKRVVVLDNQVNRELAASLNDARLKIVGSARELKPAIAKALEASASTPMNIRRWKDVAAEYVTGFRDLLGRRPDASKLRARHDLVRVLDAARHP